MEEIITSKHCKFSKPTAAHWDYVFSAGKFKKQADDIEDAVNAAKCLEEQWCRNADCCMCYDDSEVIIVWENNKEMDEEGNISIIFYCNSEKSFNRNLIEFGIEYQRFREMRKQNKNKQK